MPRLGYTVNEAHFWIYFRSIERSRPSTQTDLTRVERKRRRKKEEIVRGTPNRFADRDICSFSLSLSHSSHSTTTMRTMTTTRSNQSVILLRGLFRAAISFPLKWSDPIRFHSVEFSNARACMRRRLGSFLLTAGSCAIARRDISVRDIANEIIL